MNEQIKREECVHGENWRAVHGGYFSDPAVAAALVQKVAELAAITKPNMIVDLGGGIGFVLSQLLAAGVQPGVSLVNLDDSAVQINGVKETGLSCVRGSVDSFMRRELGSEEDSFLFMMRSVLHYFGEDGLRPVLRHLRTQAEPGEYFVHQTASFRRQEDADRLNDLYKMMRTEKWYPTVGLLGECLQSEGWHVLDVLPAAPLPLMDDELLQRYGLDQADISRITERLSRHPLAPEDVFQKTEYGFRAFLHYWIYVCIAE